MTIISSWQTLHTAARSDLMLPGSENKTVRMFRNLSGSGWLYWDLSFDHLKWDIALNPEVPTEVELNGGSGSIDADLRGIQMTDFSGDFGSGSSDIRLPETNAAYTAEIESGSGSVTLDLPEETSMTLTLDTGSGSTSINVPSDAALRIEVMDDGSGSLTFLTDCARALTVLLLDRRLPDRRL